MGAPQPVPAMPPRLQLVATNGRSLPHQGVRRSREVEVDAVLDPRPRLAHPKLRPPVRWRTALAGAALALAGLGALLWLVIK